MKSYAETLKILTPARIYMSGVTGAGILICLLSLNYLPFSRLDVSFLFLATATVLTGSRLPLKMPGKDVYFMMGDAFVFFIFLRYGAEAAILIAAAEAVCYSLSLRKLHPKTLTNLALSFNAANMACSTAATYASVLVFEIMSGTAVSAAGVAAAINFGSDPIDKFLMVLGMMILVQFSVNNTLAAWATALRKKITFASAFYDHCLSGSITTIGGGVAAGLIFRLIQTTNFFAIVVVIILAVVIYFTYRRHLSNLASETLHREQAESQFRHNALHDLLTGLPNRLSFIEKLTSALNETNRDPAGRGFCVMYLDLNRFKTVNDSLGHTVGNKLLALVSQRLVSEVREFRRHQPLSSARDGDVVARLGGDEFALLFHGINDEAGANIVADRIYKTISADPFQLDNYQIVTKPAIGMVIGSCDYAQPNDILRDADIAMYRAKDKGCPHVIFDRQFGAEAIAKLDTEAGLRRALEEDELKTYYQPIIELVSGKLLGFEALMRWQPPGKAMVFPDKFIPVAEDIGLIVPMTYWILRDSCRQLMKWRSLSRSNHSLYLSVNLSTKHLTETDLVEKVKQILSETDLEPQYLKLEITESGAMQNAETTLVVLQQLRRLGVEISIDDFGTGYSSLSYLHKFPFDTLKVDRSFVNKIENEAESLGIVKTIITLAQILKKKVIAEGIENSIQLELLRELGCPAAQGYLFSKPYAAEEIERSIRDKVNWLPAGAESRSSNLIHLLSPLEIKERAHQVKFNDEPVTADHSALIQ